MSDKGCPHGECANRQTDGSCDAPYDGADGVGVYHCSNRTRIICVCGQCGATSQLVALHCRKCGKKLPCLGAGATNLVSSWSQTVPVMQGHFAALPQMLTHGDCLVSLEAGNLMLRLWADGTVMASAPLPAVPAFSASPLAVRERIYVCYPGTLWSFSLSTGKSATWSLDDFQPSPKGRPIYMAGDGFDSIVIPGETNQSGRARIIFFDVRSGKVDRRYAADPLNGSLLTPAAVDGSIVLFTTDGGSIFRLKRDDGGKWAQLKMPEVPLPGKRSLSAPAFSPVSHTTYVDCVDLADRSRKALLINGERSVMVDLAGEACFPDDDLAWMIFPPMITSAGGAALLLSAMLPDCCWFVALAGAVPVSIPNLNVHPLAHTHGEGKVLTVTHGGAIQIFQAVPGVQGCTEKSLSALRQTPIVGKPLYYLGRLFIRTTNSLMGVDV